MSYSDFFPSTKIMRTDLDDNDSETATKEDALGNPSVDGQVLASTDSGTRSWVDIGGSSAMVWTGTWADGSYDENEVTRDGNWTMIANTTTTDRPAPQENGASERDTENTVFADITGPSNTVKMVHNYTMTKSGWLQGLWVKAPEFTVDTVVRVVTANTTTGQASSKDNILLNAGEWTLLAVDDLIIKTGDDLVVSFSIYNSTQASEITGNWDIVVGPTGGATTNGELIINDSNTPTSIEYDYDDLDNINRAGELDLVAVGSIITISETGDTSRYIECEVTAVDTNPLTSVIYTVTTLSSNKDVRDGNESSNTINVPITAPTHYYEAVTDRPGNNPSWATITSELYHGGVDQTVTDSAFGIDLQFQEASVSSDWDLVSLSSSSSGSSSSSLGSYDYTKVTGYTNALGGTYTLIGQLITPIRPIGTYETKLSMTWKSSANNAVSSFRWREDGGVWYDFTGRATTADENIPKYYAYSVVQTTETTKTIEVEASTDTGTLTVDFLDIIYERKI